ITEGGVNQALKCISHGFLPREQDIRDLNEAVKRTAPLMSLIRMTKFSSGHAAAVIGSQDRDPMGRLIHQMAQTLIFHVP
ncbi:MAG: hypothetical protein ACREHD_08950, partial [Pirellulales bacterium]